MSNLLSSICFVLIESNKMKLACFQMHLYHHRTFSTSIFHWSITFMINRFIDRTLRLTIHQSCDMRCCCSDRTNLSQILFINVKSIKCVRCWMMWGACLWHWMHLVCTQQRTCSIRTYSQLKRCLPIILNTCIEGSGQI